MTDTITILAEKGSPLSHTEMDNNFRALRNLVEVPTVAALRALGDGAIPTDAGTAITHGCLAAGDGGGGVWRWDAASTVTDNTGTVVKPTAVGDGAGRWHRIFTGAVAPEWFGAVGDGVTDDHAAIQAAIDCNYPNTGSCVQFSTKTYLLTDTLVLPETGVKLVGANKKDTVLSFVITDEVSPAVVMSGCGVLRASMPNRRIFEDLQDQGYGTTISILSDAWRYGDKQLASGAGTFSNLPLATGGLPDWLNLSALTYQGNGIVRATVGSSRYTEMPSNSLAAFHTTHRVVINGSALASAHKGTFQITTVNKSAGWVEYTNNSVTAANDVTGLAANAYISLYSDPANTSVEIQSLTVKGDYNALDAPTSSLNADGLVFAGVTGAKLSIKDVIVSGFRGVGLTCSHCYAGNVSDCELIYNGVGLYTMAQFGEIKNVYSHYNLVGMQQTVPGPGCVIEANAHYGLLFDSQVASTLQLSLNKVHFEANGLINGGWPAGSNHYVEGASAIRVYKRYATNVRMDTCGFSSLYPKSHNYKGGAILFSMSNTTYFEASSTQYTPFCIENIGTNNAKLEIYDDRLINYLEKRVYAFESYRPYNAFHVAASNYDSWYIIDVSTSNAVITDYNGENYLCLPAGYRHFVLTNSGVAPVTINSLVWAAYIGNNPFQSGLRPVTALSGGDEYCIAVPGTTDFTLIGAADSAQYTVFTATGAGTGSGHAWKTTASGAFVIGTRYRIATPGTTDFTAIGARNNTTGTVFVATGVGSGTGTATAFTAAIPIVTGEREIKLTRAYSVTSDIILQHTLGPTYSTIQLFQTGTGSITLQAGESLSLSSMNAPGSELRALKYVPYINATYTPTNVTPDRAFDADTVTVSELADVVGTLINDLKQTNLIR